MFYVYCLAYPYHQSISTDRVLNPDIHLKYEVVNSVFGSHPQDDKAIIASGAEQDGVICSA